MKSYREGALVKPPALSRATQNDPNIKKATSITNVIRTGRSVKFVGRFIDLDLDIFFNRGKMFQMLNAIVSELKRRPTHCHKYGTVGSWC